ncbi:hypothetical protein H6G35_35645 [Aulosira sp. FACHB-113]|nr:hypothetical protein [Aulosira sp. FACHB-113]
MTARKICNLTPEQSELIPVYNQKWKNIALSTEPIDRRESVEIIKELYSFLGLNEPEVVVCVSPAAVLNFLAEPPYPASNREMYYIYSLLNNPLRQELYSQLYDALKAELRVRLSMRFTQNIHYLIEREIYNFFDKRYLKYSEDGEGDIKGFGIDLPEPMESGCELDFCISVLNCNCSPVRWQIFESLAKNSFWLFPYDRLAVVCERPTKISFDDQQRPHAVMQPAIQFADGYSIYAHHGVVIPEKYANLHPLQWQTQWLLENNTQLRKPFIQEITDHQRIERALVTQLDSQEEYTLLEIDDNVDAKTIYFLKMTCPITREIHALIHVPADIKSVHQAILWVNWGIEPEEFVMPYLS